MGLLLVLNLIARGSICLHVVFCLAASIWRVHWPRDTEHRQIGALVRLYGKTVKTVHIIAHIRH
jgi:hypothetical protein